MANEVAGLAGLHHVGSDELGTLFEATLEADQRPVAVRLLAQPLTSDQERQLRTTVAKLPVHKALASVLELYVSDDAQCYIVTGPRKGETLRDRRDRDALLSVTDAVVVLREIGQALSELHRHGVVHGAVTPAAILCRPDGYSLLDVGVAQALGLVPPPPESAAGEVARCLAPEMVAGEPASAAGDVFGLAATVFELITGRSVYTWLPGQPVSALSQPAGPAFDLSGVPVGVADVLRLALDARPQRRPPAEMLARVAVVAVADDAEAPVIDADVAFTVYRPRTVQPKRWYKLLAFAHKSEPFVDDMTGRTVDPEAMVSAQAAGALGEQLPGYAARKDDGLASLPEGSDLCFVPEVPGLEFNPPERSFRWYGPVHQEAFELRASARLDGQVARGQMRVFLGGAVIAVLNLAIPVSSSVADKPIVEHERVRRSHKIFVSYSHLDRHVVEHVFKDVKAIGAIKVLWDKDLETGEVWSEHLAKMIDDADTFQLFWSTNSMVSDYVRQEWTYALGLGRDNFIFPVYWEDPRPARPEAGLPPAELDRLHFGHLPGSRGSPTPVGAPVAAAPSPLITLRSPAGPPLTQAKSVPSLPPMSPARGRSGRSTRIRELMVAGAASATVVAGVAAATIFGSAGSGHPGQLPSATSTIFLPASTVTVPVTTPPSGFLPPRAQCRPAAQANVPAGLIGVDNADNCTDSALPGGTIRAYQFDTAAHFGGALDELNKAGGFDPSAPKVGLVCPPTAQFSAGRMSYTGGTRGGQLECYSNASNEPVYVWTVPEQQAILVAVGGPQEDFGGLDTWWLRNGGP